MATHSSVLAWRIPGMGGLMGCHLWGLTESDMTEVTWQQQQQYRLHRKGPIDLEKYKPDQGSENELTLQYPQ